MEYIVISEKWELLLFNLAFIVFLFYINDLPEDYYFRFSTFFDVTA